MIKELRIEFTRTGEMDGFTFKQLMKNDFGYIYQVTSIEGDIHYEVFPRRINELYNTVTYPSSEAFGRFAWCYRDLNKAKAKYDGFIIH